MFIKSIDIQGLLSFRNASLEMRPLNVLIGPNASGKSNFIEIMALLQALPRDLAGFISRGGGISDWLWKGKPDGAVAGGVRLEVNNPVSVLPHDVAAPLAYSLRIMQEAGRTAIQHESMSVLNIGNNGSDGSRLFETANGTANVTRLSTYPGDGTVDIPPRAVKTGQSLLRDLRDPRHYPEISYVRDAFDAIRLYRDLALGPKSNMRIPVRSDEMPDYLVEDMSNLALVLSNLKLDPVCESIIEYMKKVYSRFEDFTPSIIGGTVQLWVREEGLAKSIPATRLSDGTLRFLALLTILLHPSPPLSSASRSQSLACTRTSFPLSPIS